MFFYSWWGRVNLGNRNWLFSICILIRGHKNTFLKIIYLFNNVRLFVVASSGSDCWRYNKFRMWKATGRCQKRNFLYGMCFTTAEGLASVFLILFWWLESRLRKYCFVDQCKFYQIRCMQHSYSLSFGNFEKHFFCVINNNSWVFW